MILIMLNWLMEELGHSSPHVYDYLIYDKGDCRVAIKDNVTVHIEKKKILAFTPKCTQKLFEDGFWV